MIKSFIDRVTYRLFTRPWRRILSVIAYARQGWLTEDWDYDYLVKDVEFKLKRMQAYFSKGEILDAGCTQIMMEQMAELLDLFEKIRKDEYEGEKGQREANRDWIRVWRLMAEYLPNLWD